MNGVSGLVFCDLSAGEDRLVSADPVVLTSVVACERTSTDPAALLLTGASGEGPYYRIRLQAGEMFAFADRVALPCGLVVLCQAGDAAVTVGYA